MDENRVQELLEKAGAEYNQGRYAEAIANWQEVLKEDPENQKAREGIRMAKLLVVNWESAQGADAGDELTLEAGGLDPETQEKIDFGVKRIRELMSAGRNKEAMEGSQLLAELAPGAAAVKQLQEEISHALEAQPFVEEHLGKARKLLAANKVAEAQEEARKVLSVDPTNEEARVICSHTEGGEGAGPETPSAFGTEGAAAPPSPFAGSTSADEIAMNMGFDEAEPQQAAPEGGLEMGFDEAGEAAPAAAGAGEGQVRAIIEEGQRLFEQKKYQDSIEAWSRVYAVDESNAEVPPLIDKANAKIAEIGALAEQAMYQAQDQLDAGNLPGAKKAFEEVLSIMPGNPEALDQISRIDEKLGLQAEDDLGDAIPMEEPVAPAAPAGPPPPTGHEAVEMPDAPSVGLAGDPEDQRDSTRPIPAPSQGPGGDPDAPVSAGIPKRKPVQAVPPPKKGPNMAVVGALGLMVVVAIAAGWWFLMGPGAEPPAPLEPGVQASDGPLPGSDPTDGSPAAGDVEEGESPDGGEAVVEAVDAAGSQPPAPPDPATVRRQVRALMREGRVLLDRKKYSESLAKFDEALRLDPSNFDAEEMKMRASAGVGEEARFNRDLESARGAYDDQDWGSSLYKLYRLQMERREMSILSTYIRNANYNWGVQAMEAFQVSEALEHFNDALEQTPGDRNIQQHIDVANRYERRRRDSAYDAYVSKLALVAMDAR